MAGAGAAVGGLRAGVDGSGLPARIGQSRTVGWSLPTDELPSRRYIRPGHDPVTELITCVASARAVI